MASFAAHDFFRTPTWERLAAPAAPDTERSPAFASETRIGVGEPWSQAQAAAVEDTFWDDCWKNPGEESQAEAEPQAQEDLEPPTQRYGADASGAHVVLRPSEPTLLCAGVVRPAAVSAPAALEHEPAPTSDVRPVKSETRPRAPSVPDASHGGPDSLAMQVSERILGAVFRIGHAVERWLPSG